MITFFLFCWGLFSCLSCEANVPKTLNFIENEEFPAFVDQEILIRGFLYQNHENQWLLSSEPNLRRCCMGKGELQNQQIFLFNDQASNIKPNASAVLLKGYLRKKGERYWLDDALIIEEPLANVFWLIVMGLIGLLVIGLFFCLKKLIRKNGESARHDLN